MPSASSAHVCSPPAAIATALVRPATLTGEERSVVVPSPSWPRSLKPQHETVPSARSAHVWIVPAVIATTLARPAMLTGVDRSVVVWSPSWPKKL